MSEQDLYKVHPTFGGLPAACYGTNRTTGETSGIRRGEMGFYPLKDEHMRKLPADELNAEMGITKGQAEAMSAGSMFGWHVPGADPANYDEDGRFRQDFIEQIQRAAGVTHEEAVEDVD
jgi:hypothetical protein